MGSRRKHGDEFKREAVKLALQPGRTKSGVARDLGIHISVLRHWIRQFEAGKWEATPGKSLKSEQQLEIERLRRELAKAQTERDILKKAVAYFAKEPK
jgi:transposase